MAKMFYTLEEAAEKLGVEPDQVMEMAGQGKLQQLRDGDRLMFKRDQVDSMAPSGSGDTASGSTTTELTLDDTSGVIPLANSDDTDVVDMVSADSDVMDIAGDSAAGGLMGGSTAAAAAISSDDSAPAEGISVFDADDETGDASDQTQMTAALDDEELALDSIGSGSGLLDLTRESDDTSLGAELLNEIYPSGGDGPDSASDTAPSASGVFDDEAATGFGSSLGGEAIPDSGPPVAAAMGGGALIAVEPFDPSGSGLSNGLLLGATVSLVLTLIVAVYAVASVPSALTNAMSRNVLAYCGAILLACLVLGVVGFLVGKAQEN